MERRTQRSRYETKVPDGETLSAVRNETVAILCSDLHLSLHPPCSREDPDWFEAMARALAELKEVAEKHRAPIVCGGDVFDYWKVEPELLNFAMIHLPFMWTIPGQHDMPLHRHDLLYRSGLYSLHLSGHVGLLPVFSETSTKEEREETLINPDAPYEEFVYPPTRLSIYGFPWGSSLRPLKKDKDDNRLNLAVAHSYIWQGSNKYPGAPETSEFSSYKKVLKGYDAALFGDNHKGFLTKIGPTTVFNAGGFMRRKSDEVDYTPQIGILKSDGSITPYFLSIDQDVLRTQKEKMKDGREILERFGIEEFTKMFEQIEMDGTDFVSELEKVLDNLDAPTRVLEIIREAYPNG